MAGFPRAKRVTDPLDDRVKNRIFGREKPEPFYVSSGSEHSGRNDDESDSPSPCLSNLLYGFLPDAGQQDDVNDDDEATSPGNDDSEHDFSMPDRSDAIDGVITRVLLSQNEDRFRNVLSAHVYKAIEVFSFAKANKSLSLRNVMAYLRNHGYNAAVCKTKWENSGGLTAGSYEFIDVVRSNSGTRYFIDLDFSAEFEIARQTSQYQRHLQSLPRVFIGKSEDLKQIVKVVCDAAKRSLKSRELLLPPWRKNRFMQNKYFGPYRRTVNLISANSSSLSTPTKPTLGVVKCRSVGFNAVNGPLLLPAATRTR